MVPDLLMTDSMSLTTLLCMDGLSNIKAIAQNVIYKIFKFIISEYPDIHDLEWTTRQMIKYVVSNLRYIHT